jgi:hypothetical protein
MSLGSASTFNGFSIFGTAHRDDARFRLALGEFNSNCMAGAVSRQCDFAHASPGRLQLTLGASIES